MDDPRTWSITGRHRTSVALFGLFLFLVAVCVSGLPESFQAPDGRSEYLVTDDSMITLRVSEHISQGIGPYFNAGEHVAANTSTIWPYLMAPFFWLGHDAGRTVLVLSLLSTFLTASIIVLAALRAGSWFAVCGVAATLLAMPCFAYYGSTAWEQVPQTLLVTLAFLVLLGRLPSFRELRAETALPIAAIGFLIRPDTMPILFVLAVVTAWRLAASRENRVPRIGALCFAAASVVFYYSLQHHLYGDFVPNTFHLKVGLGPQSVSQGLRYLAVSALDTGIPVLLAGAMLLRLRRSPSLVPEEKIVFAAILAQAAYIVVVGGDIFHYGRFVMLLGPVAAVLLWREAEALIGPVPEAGRPGLQDTSPAPERKTGTVVVAVCLASVVFASFVRLIREEKWNHRVWTYTGALVPNEDLQDQAILAPYLRSHLSPADGQIGIFTLGSLPYYLPEYTFADFLGKADPVIAHEKPKWGPTGHNKWDFLHSLRDRNVSAVPFIMLPGATAQALVAAHTPFVGGATLQLDPYMQAHYSYRSPAQLGLPGPYGLLIRNDLLNRFPGS